MSDNKQLIDVFMPQLAESLVSATVGKWLKQPGDRIEQYEPICEVITDKVNAEIPSTVDGIMGELIAEEGQTIGVGEVICRISVISTNESVSVNKPANTVTAEASSTISSDQSMRSRYSPAVQSLAAEHGLNLADIPGTGMAGRITRKDVLAYVEGGHSEQARPSTVSSDVTGGINSPFQGLSHTNPAVTPSQYVENKSPAARNSGLHLNENPQIPNNVIEGQQGRAETLIDITPVRNTIATRMRQSVSEIPHAWTMIEVDVTNLVLIRNKLKDEFKRNEGVNLTYLAFLLKAVVNAIKDYPIMNSVWATDKIIVKRDINISLAVGTDDTVMVPVIQKADQKNIAGLAKEVEDLATKTRQGKLKLDDMQGGTFTVNNTGSFGSVLSYPIINYPQAAILTFESIVKRPVVINDMIAVRSMANICLSLDHRILDGVICGRFLQRVKENLEGYTLDTKLY
ncbi:dihydrolipoamide acetyltransferase family protein [Paenibacillus macquariensis]|uniref:Dihydrolipoamide acetyltransferase component of pyruvate dehydrogenase complex n=1 Tax=Paenibacillus macquariensis TaxID=948756 RepID=A0ABY1JK22_9BACL|nr:dihydrolipoamide acetyltransferase family protein [Paenibacillus macquariensis]MEC0089846.1 dihydrolipoamide acetyltransferase family protein [Paenibacillus macquariensis]OAB30690.1 branched-chain alpha-keto acid dehydrogenase subunit E2 [Paenibacillus macquariensis subsp. macquariensis]SIQ32530.1 2-oxoisovalerate dehydrogenase E2 component (dihydrolipoyl transacylase) [Paenibacillus macquariensis]